MTTFIDGQWKILVEGMHGVSLEINFIFTDALENNKGMSRSTMSDMRYTCLVTR